MRLLAGIVWVFLLLLGLGFTLLNSQPVSIDYYLGKTTMYFPLLFLILLAVGALLGIFSMIIPLIRLKSVLRKLLKKNKLLEQELFTLKRDVSEH